MGHRVSTALVIVLIAISTALAIAGCAGGASNPPPQQNTAPTIASFSPTSGPSGSSVTIAGTNLTGANAVAFNGMVATFTVNGATQITATVPNGATTGRVLVTTTRGTASSAANFTVTIPGPGITSFSPTSGSAGTGVTITGTRFTGATSVRFNGVGAAFTVTDDSHISTSVPGGATSGTLSVTTASGTATSDRKSTRLNSSHRL